MTKKISEKSAKALRTTADEDVSDDTDERNTSKEKKPSSKSIKIDSEIYERYFANTDKKEISSIVEQALEMYFISFD